MAQSTPKLETKEIEVDKQTSQISIIGTSSTPSENPMLRRGEVGELEVVDAADTTLEGTRSPNKVQVNVKNALIGTNVTLTNNVKLHRAGNGELGFVLGDDSGSEGSRSSNNALIQAKSIVLGDSPNQTFNIKMRRAGNGLVQFTLGDDSYADGVYSPNYADVLGSVPIGSIVAWNPGYYLDASNGTFVNASFLPNNTIAGANSYLNPRGFYVADGAVPNVSGTLIWNASGRYLPNLTDDRFLMGGTSCGSSGGQNSVTLTEDNLPEHTHAIDHSHTSSSITGSTSSDGSHTHAHHPGEATTSVAGGADHVVFNQTGSTQSTSTAGAHTHSITGTAAGQTYTGNSGTTGADDSFENRPKYLSTFFIVRVF